MSWADAIQYFAGVVVGAAVYQWGYRNGKKDQ